MKQVFFVLVGIFGEGEPSAFSRNMESSSFGTFE